MNKTTLTIKPILDLKVKGAGKLGRNVKITPHVDKNAGVYVTNIPEDRVDFLSKALGFDVSDVAYYQDREQNWDRSDLILVIGKDEVSLDTRNPLNEVKSYLYSDHPFVAPSMDKLESGEYPDALAVVFNRAVESSQKSKSIIRKRKINSYISELSIAQKIDLLVYVQNKLYTDSNFDDIEITLDKTINSKPELIEEYIKVKKNKPTETSLIVKIKTALIKNVLIQDGATIMFEGMKLGDSISEVVQYLVDPNNQMEKLKIYKVMGATHLIPNQKAKKSRTKKTS